MKSPHVKPPDDVTVDSLSNALDPALMAPVPDIVIVPRVLVILAPVFVAVRVFAPVVNAAPFPFKVMVDKNVQAPPSVIDSEAPSATAGA